MAADTETIAICVHIQGIGAGINFFAIVETVAFRVSKCVVCAPEQFFHIRKTVVVIILGELVEMIRKAVIITVRRSLVLIVDPIPIVIVPKLHVIGMTVDVVRVAITITIHQENLLIVVDSVVVVVIPA